ncbi:MAG: LysR family transcriptional regulator [Shimia sp.]|uniref:LysR family transcriptional regulator n=1 Tax=Shimia sp. TaxID=1954381 RepID=UPI0040584947
MNLTKLRYVVAVDRHSAITAAARALNVTQSAVTKAVADVEQEVGAALFDRHARGVAATAAGRAFIDRAARILADMDQLVADVGAGRESREQVLRIGVSSSSLEGLMSRAIWALVGAHPEVRVQMRGAPFEAAVQLFRQGDLDAIVGPARPLMAEAGVRCDTLPPLVAQFYVRRGHPLAGRLVSAQEVAAYPLIVPELRGPYADPIQHLMQQIDGDPARSLHIMEDFTMAAGLIERSEAVGVVVDSYARSRQFRSRFDVLDYGLQEPLPMAVAYRSSGRQDRALGWFRKAVQDYPPTSDAQMP